MATESPYPVTLPYRVEMLEKWREQIEKEGMPKALAIMETQNRTVLEDLRETRNEVTALRSLVLDHDKVLQRRSGGLSTIEKALVIGLGTPVVVGSFILQLVSVLGVA